MSRVAKKRGQYSQLFCLSVKFADVIVTRFVFFNIIDIIKKIWIIYKIRRFYADEISFIRDTYAYDFIWYGRKGRDAAKIR